MKLLLSVLILLSVSLSAEAIHCYYGNNIVPYSIRLVAHKHDDYCVIVEELDAASGVKIYYFMGMKGELPRGMRMFGKKENECYAEKEDGNWHTKCVCRSSRCNSPRRDMAVSFGSELSEFGKNWMETTRY